MAANSKHRLDILAWMYKVIDSCENIQQAINAKKLINYFRKQYPLIVGTNDWDEYELIIDHALRKIDKMINLHCEKNKQK